MIVTNKILERVKTERGGYTRKQLATLGVAWPPQKGWKDMVINKDVKDWRVLFEERNKSAK